MKKNTESIQRDDICQLYFGNGLKIFIKNISGIIYLTTFISSRSLWIAV